jgi:hypothetical protein
LAFAQIPDTSWTRTYGGTYVDICWSIQQTSDDGYILGGYTGSFGVQALDFYLVKTDSAGDTLWTRTYGGQYRDEAYAVTQTSDDGYIMTGWSASFAPGRYLWIVKTDSVGDTIWTKLYQRQGFSWGWSIQECHTPENYIISGHDYYEAYLMKIDQSGDTLWTNKYGNGVLYSAHQTADSGYIATGMLSFVDLLFLVKTDSDGDTIWTRTYQHGEVNYGRSVRQTPDGGYVIAGYTGSYNDADAYIIRTDSAGDTIWTCVYGGPGSDAAYSAIQTSDGNFMVVGFTESFSTAGVDMWVMKLDAGGDTIWTKAIGGLGNEFAHSLIECCDGGYAVAGYSTSFGSGASDYYLVKLEPETGKMENYRPPVKTSRLNTTITSGPLSYPDDGKCRLLDITGREIDAEHATSGVYYIMGDDKVVSKIIKIH